MSSLSQREVTDKLIKEMAILMLSLEERDPAFGNEAAWDFIATELIGENNRKAVLHYLKGEMRPLVRLGTDSIRIASIGAKELLSLLHNSCTRQRRVSRCQKVPCKLIRSRYPINCVQSLLHWWWRKVSAFIATNLP